MNVVKHANLDARHELWSGQRYTFEHLELQRSRRPKHGSSGLPLFQLNIGRRDHLKTAVGAFASDGRGSP